MAPGSGIYSTYLDGQYCYMDGTSMACPVVAGAAAVLMGMGCTDLEAWELLLASATERQGKTQPDRTVRKYPALNLSAAVEMKKHDTAPEAAPIPTDGWLYTDIEPLNLGNGVVDLSGFVDSYLLFYKGELKSTLELELHNIGGSGEITLTGTVGGVEVKPETIHLERNDWGYWTPELKAGTVIRSDSQVVIALYANGELIYSSTKAALDIVPLSQCSGINRQGNDYTVSGEVRLEGSASCSPLFVQDLNVRITSGNGLYVTYGSGQAYPTYYYQTAGKKVITNGTGFFILQSTVAGGAENFSCSGSGGEGFYNCSINAPWIQGAQEMKNCRVYGAGKKSLVEAYEIQYCGFYFAEITINCTKILSSLINRCSYSQLNADSMARFLALVENYVYDDGGSVLTVRAPNTDSASVSGLRESAVVGPMNVYRKGYNTQATVYRLYTQKAWDAYLSFNDTVWFNQYASTWTDDPDTFLGWQADSNGVSWYIPAFLIGSGEDAPIYSDYDAAGGIHDALEYTVELYFSKPIAEWSSPYCYSGWDGMADSAAFKKSADLKSATATVLSLPGSDDARCDVYYFGGICGMLENQYWPTPTILDTQAVALYSSRYDAGMEETAVSISDGKACLTWSDSRLSYGYTATISRSTDGGPMKKIGTASGTAGSFTDSNVSAGHLYSYEVAVHKDESNSYYGYATVLYPTRTADGKEDLAITPDVQEGAVTFCLNSPWITSQEEPLEYTLPDTMAQNLHFSEELLRRGIPYAAVDNGDGTVSVTIGAEGACSTLLAGELFTMMPSEDEELGMLEGDVYCITDEALQLWHIGSTKMIVAGYQQGKMLDAAVTEEAGGIYQIRAQEGGSFKVFFPDAHWSPLREAIPLS